MRQRIGLLADIHANVWALEAVLADVRKQGVDVLWNLGDILHGALKPRATYDLLRSTDIALTIRGNQDRELFEAQRRSEGRVDDSRSGRGRDRVASRFAGDGGIRG